ncbi:MAG: RNA chaperone Hfq [Acidobacteria bacterium]|nr:RNA chaperone Hfq [Acidobacteriota bacterium]
MKLTGKIRSFDKFSLVLESKFGQLIFKLSTVSTISMPRGEFPPASSGVINVHGGSVFSPGAGEPVPGGGTSTASSGS